MKTLVRIGALSCFVSACVLLIGCGGRAPVATMDVSASQGGGYSKDVIRVGDRITIQLGGVPDNGFFVERQIPPSGDFNLPLLTQTFQATGNTTAQLAQEITEAYKTQKIYTNPVVTVLAEERFITLTGEVRSPSNVLYRPDLTLISAINSCGGFSDYANRRSIRIIRGKDIFYVDGIKAADTPGADPPVYPGDQINVARAMF